MTHKVLVGETTQPPSVSVCIPTYNRPELLRNLLRSVLAQSFHHLEVVITDNSSDLRTHNMIKSEFPDQRIRYFHNGANIGMALNARKSLSLSRGSFVAFTPDDDLWIRTDKLERQISALEEFNALVSFSGFDHIDVSGSLHESQFPNPRPQGQGPIPVPKEEFLPGCGSGTWTVGVLTALISRDLLPLLLESWTFGSEELFMWGLGLSDVVTVFDPEHLVALRDAGHIWEVRDRRGRIGNFRLDADLRGQNLIDSVTAARYLLPSVRDADRIVLEEQILRRTIQMRPIKTLRDHSRFTALTSKQRVRILGQEYLAAALRNLKRVRRPSS